MNQAGLHSKSSCNTFFRMVPFPGLKLSLVDGLHISRFEEVA